MPPFCSDAQKRESKSNKKCASLYPVEGTFTYFFSCNRGLNGGVQGVQSCNHTMRSLRLNAIRQLAKNVHPATSGVFYYLLNSSKAETAYCNGHLPSKQAILRSIDLILINAAFSAPVVIAHWRCGSCISQFSNKSGSETFLLPHILYETDLGYNFS